MTAIDISSYQGHPDFAQVKSAGVQLVIMRMGGADGGLYLDRVYLANRAAARAQGLPIGSYFFNGPAISPAACADWMLANGDYRPGDLMVIDVEGSVAWSPAQVLTWVQRMLARGVRIQDVGVYMSASPERSQNWSAVAATGAFLWVASYGSNNGTPGTPPVPAHWSHWSLWQYTSTATCPGVSGRVDTSLISGLSTAGLGSSPLTESTIMPEVIIHISDASGKTVKSGEYYYHRDGVTPIIGPLSGADPSKAGGIYWLNTVTGVPIKDVGGATFEFYQADQAKRVLAGVAGGPVTVNAQVDVQPELVAALKDPTVLAALESAIKFPTKVESVFVP